MSLDDYLKRVFVHRQRAYLEAESEAARNAQQRDGDRGKAEHSLRTEREARAAELARRSHLVYVGRGLGRSQESHVTVVGDWDYEPGGGYHQSGFDGGHHVDTSERFIYKSRESVGVSSVDFDEITEDSRVVGYYLPEWDLSIPMNLATDIRELRDDLWLEADALDDAKVRGQRHLVYVGRGLDASQEKRYTVLGDWNYKHWCASNPAVFTYKERSTCKYEKILDNRLTVGYYLPELDMSLPLALVRAIRAL